jgi:uncharacterized protein
MLHKDYLLGILQSQFKLDFYGVHGLPHWERVAERGEALSRLTGANPKVVEYFAYLHDSKRQNDDDDPEHGLRASRYCQNLYDDGVIDLTLPELDQLSNAVRLHNMRHIAGDTTCQTCWDADRLDIGRVGKIPSPARLFTSAAKKMAVQMQSEVALHEWL